LGLTILIQIYGRRILSENPIVNKRADFSALSSFLNYLTILLIPLNYIYFFNPGHILIQNIAILLMRFLKGNVREIIRFTTLWDAKQDGN